MPIRLDIPLFTTPAVIHDIAIHRTTHILSCTELEMSHGLKHAHTHFGPGLVLCLLNVTVEMRSCDTGLTQHVVYESEMWLKLHAVQITTGLLTLDNRRHLIDRLIWGLKHWKDEIKISLSSIHVLSHKHICASELNGVKLDEVLMSSVNITR